jgi:hypothetical protein
MNWSLMLTLSPVVLLSLLIIAMTVGPAVMRALGFLSPTSAAPAAAAQVVMTHAASAAQAKPAQDRASRALLPMSSGVNILPNTSAQITSRLQNFAFRPERILIGGTPGDWIVNDIKVGNRSQFSQSGDIPGETFASTATDPFVSFATVSDGQPFAMTVTYVGGNPDGAPFVCAVLGIATPVESTPELETTPAAMPQPQVTVTMLAKPALATEPAPATDFLGKAKPSIDAKLPARITLLPMGSGCAIRPGQSAQITNKSKSGPFLPEGIIIGGNPDKWMINDITIDGVSQLIDPGDVPGEAFSAVQIDKFISFHVVGVDKKFAIHVTYIGTEPNGAEFRCSVIGHPADEAAEAESLKPVPATSNSLFLPLNSSYKILPNTSAEVASVLQRVGEFCCDRVIISGTPGDWIVNDIKVGNRSQFSQSGDVPGEMFSARATEASLSFERWYAGMTFAVYVTYVGADPEGAFFAGSALGSVGNRNVDHPDRVILPMCSGVNILPNTSAQITSRPQNVAFRPERILIGGKPEDWVVNDIKVGNRSQLAQNGSLPGDMFSETSTLRAYALDTVQTAMDFIMIVTYVGDAANGAPFLCGAIGTVAL